MRDHKYFPVMSVVGAVLVLLFLADSALLAPAMLLTVALVGAVFALGIVGERRRAAMPLIDDSVLLPAPPPELTPALAVLLRTGHAGLSAYVAALADLAHRGLISFELAGDELTAGVSIHTYPKPRHDRETEIANRRPLGPVEADLLIQLRRAGGVGEIFGRRQAEADWKGRDLYRHFCRRLSREYGHSSWFCANPDLTRRTWVMRGTTLGLIGAVLWFAAVSTSDLSPALGQGNVPGFAAWTIAGTLIALVAYLRTSTRTPAGAQLAAMTEAYRNTLIAALGTPGNFDDIFSATQDRLDWIATPDMLTVWLLALGLRDRAFERLHASFIDDELKDPGSARHYLPIALLPNSVKVLAEENISPRG